MVWHFEKCTHWIVTFGNINPIFITTKMLPKVTIQELIQQYPALCGVKGNFISHLCIAIQYPDDKDKTYSVSNYSFCCSFASFLVFVPLVGQGSLFFKKWSFSYKFTFEVLWKKGKGKSFFEGKKLILFSFWWPRAISFVAESQRWNLSLTSLTAGV